MVALAWTGLALGCGRPVELPGPDGGSKVPKDGGMDAGVDAGTDAGSMPEACAAPGAVCDGRTGLCSTLPACSSAKPCTDLTGRTVTTAFTAPRCRTLAPGRPSFNDSPPRTWSDSVTGEDRAACVFRPPGAGLRPLVLYFHGWSGTADVIYNSTLLRQKAATFPMNGDGGVNGFVLASDQGRNLLMPVGEVASQTGGGTAHDAYFRSTGALSTNPDFRNADRLIDELVAAGGIDPGRIYVMGWSNGAFFAQLYAFSRHVIATPGGNRVAAAAVYSGGDPFAGIGVDDGTRCAFKSVPMLQLPVFFVHRDCDSATCDEAQRVALGRPVSNNATAWMARLTGELGDGDVTHVMLDAAAQPRTSCAPTSSCTSDLAGSNHLNWPDGVGDGSGRDWEPAMLEFLRARHL
ncbi:MAG: hypothetical protein K1X89_29080 [Myxococcaceae bacterium]|nr:hypothetical protein [Myxococcaceae bacterium]